MFIAEDEATAPPSPAAGGSAATREAILDAAMACVRRFGIRRTTMEEVARQAKLSRGAVYRYFPDKDALVAAVLLRNGHRVRERLEQLLDAAPTFGEKLHHAAALSLSPRKGDLLLDLAETDPEHLALMLTVEAAPWIARAARFWEPYVRAAQDTGEIAADIDAAAAAEWIARTLYSAAITPSPRADPKRPTPAATFVSSFLFRSLQSPATA